MTVQVFKYKFPKPNLWLFTTLEEQVAFPLLRIPFIVFAS